MKNRTKEVDEKATSTTRTSKSNRRRKGRSQARGKSRIDKAQNEAVANSTNDPAWYAQSPELLRDSAQIPFSWSSGAPYAAPSFYNLRTLPGVITLGLKQTISETTSKYDPANVASDAIYSFVRHANSGHSNYDAPDLMMYLLGMSSIYSFITWCQRLLGLVMCFDQRNRYLPDVLLKANGVHPDNLRNNIANFRFWLNAFITKASSFAIPAVMPYFTRMAFLYSNVYIDGPSIKDQLYMYVPENSEFLRFAISSSTSLGFLHYQAVPKSLDSFSSVSDIETFGDQLFARMWEQEDFGIMSGDILKAYGDNIIKLAGVPEMMVLQPVYDPVFLHQFKNAIPTATGTLFVGDIAVDSSGIIKQQVRVDNSIDANTKKAFIQYLAGNQLLTSDFDHPTPEVIIESTRLMIAVDPNTPEEDRAVNCGSELPINATIWYNNGNMTPANVTYGMMGRIYNEGAIVTERVQRYFRIADLVSKFKYAPKFNVFADEVLPVGMMAQQFYSMWDVDNYAVLNHEDLRKMHTAAMMSLLAVPSIAKI